MSICCKLVRSFAVVVLAAYVAPQELNSTLYSTISGVLVAFSDENVVFTCVTRGSNQMGWSSDEYIGTGGRRLEFISTNAPGTNRTSGATRAELVSASVDQFIVSQLFINIESTIPVATVQCQNIGAGTMNSLTFKLADNDVSITCNKPSVCPGETVTCVCAIGGSNTLAWVIDGRRLVFTSTDPLLSRRNITGSSTYGILTDTSNRNGIGVITSNLTATASMSATSTLIRCENVDGSTSNFAIIPDSQNCPDPNETTPSPGVTEPTQSISDDRTPAIIALAIVCAILFVVAIIMAIITCIVITGHNKKITEVTERLEGEKQTLTTEKNEEKERLRQTLTTEKNEEKERLRQTLTTEKNEEKERLRQTLTTKKNEEIEQLKQALTTKKDDEILQLKQALTTKKDEEIVQLKRALTTKKNEEIEQLKQALTTKKNEEIKQLKQRLTSELEDKQLEQEKKKVERKRPTKKVDDPSTSTAPRPEAGSGLPSGYWPPPSQRNGQGAGTSQRKI